MTLHPDIVARIRALGGQIPDTAPTLADHLKATSFERGLCVQVEKIDPIENVLDYFFYAHPEYAGKRLTDYQEALLNWAYPPRGSDNPPFEWVGRTFTPFHPGTDDYDAYWFDGSPAPQSISELAALTSEELPTFIFLIWSNGCPDHYLVLTDDKNPSDPQVLTTDHETFPADLYPEGPLSEFLARCYTPDELIAAARQWEDQ